MGVASCASCASGSLVSFRAAAAAAVVAAATLQRCKSSSDLRGSLAGFAARAPKLAKGKFAPLERPPSEANSAPACESLLPAAPHETHDDGPTNNNDNDNTSFEQTSVCAASLLGDGWRASERAVGALGAQLGAQLAANCSSGRPTWAGLGRSWRRLVAGCWLQAKSAGRAQLGALAWP